MADTFTLDTSGAVQATDAVMIATRKKRVTWGDIGALPYGQLAQGYIEAAFASIAPVSYRHRYSRGISGYCERCHKIEHRPQGWRFSDLAPETLAAMLKDCEVEQARGRFPGWTPQGAGRQFWRDRAGGKLPAIFPPVRLIVSEDGLVRQEVARG